MINMDNLPFIRNEHVVEITELRDLYVAQIVVRLCANRLLPSWPREPVDFNTLVRFLLLLRMARCVVVEVGHAVLDLVQVVVLALLRLRARALVPLEIIMLHRQDGPHVHVLRFDSVAAPATWGCLRLFILVVPLAVDLAWFDREHGWGRWQALLLDVNRSGVLRVYRRRVRRQVELTTPGAKRFVIDF